MAVYIRLSSLKHGVMCSVLILRQLLCAIKKPKASSTMVQNLFYSTSSVQVKSIFQAAVAAVEPYRLIENCVHFHNGHLVVNEQSYVLQKPCYVVAFGKAVFGMCVAIERILGDYMEEGIATVPVGIFDCFRDNELYKIPENPRIKYFEGAKNNLPDESAYKGALKIKELAEKLQSNDLLIVLVSGGGSALLPLPKEGINLTEKMDLIKKVGNKGADIMELAKVRKRLSKIKGGGLAEIAYPAKVITMILSDVIGDPVDYIAGGPTVPNTDHPKAAIEVLQKCCLLSEISESTRKVLETESPQSKVPIVDGEYKHVDNYIIGNNKIAIEAALEQATDFGYNTIVLSTHIQGEVSEIAQFYALLINYVLNQSSSLESHLENYKDAFKLNDTAIVNLRNLISEKRFCILGAGEPSVVVHGNGKGGRNQQLALAFSVELNKFDLDADITFLSCGTDGIDGPTDAAGAIGTSHLVNNSLDEGINPLDYLSDNDSYSFYSSYDSGSHLVKVGHTGTNVMDIHVILVNRKDN